MSTSTRHIVESAWHGDCPVRVVFDQRVSELFNMEPYHVLAKRTSYLVVALDSMVQALGKAFENAPDGAQGLSCKDMWLEYNGIPVKWQYPVGVLFDHFQPKGELWEIKIRFQDLPSQTVLRYQGLQTIEAHFFNSFKQGLYLKYGTTKLLMTLPKDDQERIWANFVNSDASSFHDATTSLFESQDGAQVKHIPIRLVVQSSEPLMCSQVPVPALQADGSVTTLRQAIALLDTQLPPDSTVPENHYLVAGVVPPSLDIPALELHRVLGYPEQFMYIHKL